MITNKFKILKKLTELLINKYSLKNYYYICDMLIKKIEN